MVDDVIAKSANDVKHEIARGEQDRPCSGLSVADAVEIMARPR